MPVLYITSDRPRSGKTALAAALASRMREAGRRVAYFKPLSSSAGADPDVEFLSANVLPQAGPAPASLPLSGQGDSAPDGGLGDDGLDRITSAVRELAGSTDLTIVEGPSLSVTPGDGDLAVRLAQAVDADVLLVVRYEKELGGDGVLALCEPFGRRLAGVLVNLVTRYKEREALHDIAPAVRARGIEFLGAIPEDRTMLSVTVGQIAEHLGGRWVMGRERSCDLVENLLIGGNIMDSGDTYFGRKESKAVIVRGDRPDIQMAALSRPATCLVLTGGHEPIQYVYHEAGQREVPLLVVDQDTLSAAQALDTLLERATCHHTRKVERFRELLDRKADVASVKAMSV